MNSLESLVTNDALDTPDHDTSWTSKFAQFVHGAENSKTWTTAAGAAMLGAVGVAAVATHGESGKLLGNLAKTAEEGLAGKGARTMAPLSEEVASRLRNVDTFVFDLDRTLTDYDSLYPAMRKALSEGLIEKSGLSRKFINRSLDETQTKLGSYYFYNRLDQIKPLQDKLPDVNLNERFADVSAQAQTALFGAAKAKPETEAMLQFLKDNGKHLNLFTASSPTRALVKLEGTGLSKYFDNIFVAGTNDFEDAASSKLLSPDAPVSKLVHLSADAKTDGHGYDDVLAFLKTPAHRIAMMGDSPEQDIAPAKARGMFTAEARWYRDTPSDTILPDLHLSSPSDFTDALKTAWGIK